MAKWEYLVANTGNDSLTEGWLNGYGKDGWELVSVVGACFIFKRSKATVSF